MASAAPGARSTEGSGSAGAQPNHRNDSEKPSAGKNTVLSSPSRAHDPRKTPLKLPPGVAPVTGNQHGVNSVALNFVDGILDPNLEAYKKKDRSRSTTLPVHHGEKWNLRCPQSITLRQTTLRAPIRKGRGPVLFVAIGTGLNGQNLATPTFSQRVLLKRAPLAV